MNISYHWLKQYLDFDLSPEQTAAVLTSIGLETKGAEEVQLIKGGLNGLTTGHVLTCEKHPGSDHLHITTVDVGGDEPLQIVCGAPNVAAGQKVIAALVGTTLYKGDESFVIKKSKIRGVESFGMICAEDEIGVGNSHEGIIVLPGDTPTGIPAAAYYGLESDYVLEVDITPNRVDATSHYGVARDLAARLRQSNTPCALKLPSVDHFRIDRADGGIDIRVDSAEACPRYSGLTIRGVSVKESPKWMQNALTAVGLRPINNIVDITNYVLHELGRPLHAFDADKVKGNLIVVAPAAAGTKFVTLDGLERTLSDRDLMICNAEEPMCIGGVFGGLDSGVTEGTTNVFLESANFDPSWIRGSARRHGLNTDASFRFERGLDPNGTIYALKRAALLIKELAGGEICGEIRDAYPVEAAPWEVNVRWDKINSLIGKDIPAAAVRSILDSLEIEIAEETPDGLSLRVPVYRYDVRRDVDIVEEILRIYGYNNVELSGQVRSSLSSPTDADRSYKVRNIISEQLCGAGFREIMNNSLSRASYYEDLTTWPASRAVILQNPLSAELNCMRQTLLFGGLESICRNEKRKHRNLRLFEFGNCYEFNPRSSSETGNALDSFGEDFRLGLWICGNRVENHWAHPEEESSVYELKAYAMNVLARLGFKRSAIELVAFESDIYSAGLQLLSGGVTLGRLGVVGQSLLKATGIDVEVFYAELLWTTLMAKASQHSVTFSELPRFHLVRRDLALLIDKHISFAEIERIAFAGERKRLKEVVLFDVYEGGNLPEGKKSYAVSFYLSDPDKTMTDVQIDAIMGRIRDNITKETGAELR
ncbi:MAG: phenylalanine--tRNA ligase subunit beta [Tannerellaceae bacterium]|jgi:phenylalanyl-tRNA synthetase beta chain|nr:phenylalanine--tRNA ligase subunit beta [Tannerellaceae bacterium]